MSEKKLLSKKLYFSLWIDNAFNNIKMLIIILLRKWYIHHRRI